MHNKRQKHFRHKTYISSRKHAQFMIRGYHVQIQPTPSLLHCDLEHIHRIPSTKLCVCVCARARVCVCVIFILKVVFRKLRFIKYIGGIM